MEEEEEDKEGELVVAVEVEAAAAAAVMVVVPGSGMRACQAPSLPPCRGPPRVPPSHAGKPTLPAVWS